MTNVIDFSIFVVNFEQGSSNAVFVSGNDYFEHTYGCKVT